MIAERIDQPELIDRAEPLPPLTLQEVADFYRRFRTPISAARVAQIQKRALRKLRLVLEGENTLPPPRQ